MMRWLQTAGLMCLLAGSSVHAQQAGPFLPQAGDNPDCPASAPTSQDIVICGRRDSGDRYRIPQDLRSAGQIDSTHMARAALDRDMRSREAYGAQTVGPLGATQYNREVRCEWTAERQVQQGKQIDCTRKVRGDRPGDWKGDRR